MANIDLKKALNNIGSEDSAKEIQKELFDISETSEDSITDVKSRLAEANATLTGMSVSGDSFVEIYTPEITNEPILLSKPEKGITFYSTNCNQPFSTSLPNGTLITGPYTTENKDEIKFLQWFVDNDNIPCTVSTENTFLAV